MQRSSPRLIWGVTLLTAPDMKGGGSGLVHTLLSVGIVLTLLVIPLALYRRGPHPGPSDADPGDGWRKPPEPPTPPPFHGPQGGIPLENAIPARVRLRDRERLADLVPRHARRGNSEPGRERVTLMLPSMVRRTVTPSAHDRPARQRYQGHRHPLQA